MLHSFRSLIRRRQTVARPHRRPSQRPALQVLEDRCAPAVLTVNSLADNTTADSGLTLREALLLVDGTLGRSLTGGEQAQVSGALGTNDTIQFSIPSGPQTITLTGGMLPVTKPVTINGPGAANLTINGNSLDRDLVIGQIWSKNLNLVAAINGLTITGGKQTYGAGVLNFGTLTLNNCALSNNAAGGSGGGGIYNVGALTLTNSSLVGNSTGASTSGGGIYNITGATATVTNCTFSKDVAGGTGSGGSEGGGIFNSGTITVTGCTFNANSAGSDAGAFYTDGTANLVSCGFTNNTSGADGGAIHATGALTISNCLVAGNTASSSGGGMEESGVVGSIPNSLTITNTTFVNNSASGTAGGLVNYASSVTLINDTFMGNRVTSGAGSTFGGGIWAATSLTLQNSIVAGNFKGTGTTANDVAGSLKSTSSYNLIGTGGSGGLTNGTNHNQVGVANPGLGALANNGGPTATVALLPGSPAIDKGSNAFVTAGETDQRGFSRIVNGTVDIGAFEVQGPWASTFSVTGIPTSVQAGTVATITVTARTASGGVATGYTGTVHFSSTDAQAGLPADYSFVSGDNGVHTFNVTLKTAGAQSIAATDSASASITGTQSGVTVTPAAASTLVVAGFPTPTPAGTAGSFSVTARDAFGNVATGYVGTVHFTSTDAGAMLPADYTFVTGDKGVHAFSATFETPGSQGLTATDKATGSITGTESAITVNPANNGAVLLVNSTADNTTADGSLTLREAIAVVDGTLGRPLTAGEQAQIIGTLGPNDVIQFSLPAGPQTITLTGGPLDITAPVAVSGPGAGNLTINGNNADRVFIVGQIWSQNLGLTVSMGGLTITGGSQAYGAGLLNFGTLTLTNTSFVNNTAGTGGGGGVYNVGALTLNSCTFTGNAVSAQAAGGALENISSGTATVSNCTFTNNTANGSGSSAGSGGAIANSGGMTVTGSTFSGNSAASNAGAVYNDGSLTVGTSSFLNNTALSDGGAVRSNGVLTLSSSTFAGNSAASAGGALDSSDTSLHATNCTFANNTAASQGGAIIADAGSGTAVFTNCTITGNRVTSGAGGVFGGGLMANLPVTLQDTIVAGNFQGTAPGTTADDIAGTLNSASSFNLIGTGGSGGLVAGVNGNQVGVSNPGLGTLANNGGTTLTIALLPGSPAIDRGSNAFVITGETDQRGLVRIVNGTVDIGAFEVQ